MSKKINFLQLSSPLIILFLVLSCSNEPTIVDHTDSEQTNESIEFFNSEYLIDVVKLKETLGDKTIKIIEVSKNKVFMEGHIPKALNLWRPAYETDEPLGYTGMKASKEKLESSLQRIGINQGDRIILYDKKGGSDAMRMAWLLDLYGHQDYQLLDGGFKDWELHKFPIDQKVYIQGSGNFKFTTNENMDSYISFDEMKKAVDSGSALLVDTRELEEYKGQPFEKMGHIYSYKRGAFDYGTIPDAIHFNWSENVDMHKDGKLKSVKDIKFNFKKAGISPDKDIILFCHSGSRSSHTTFVLRKLLGYKKVKNYDGSWIEWSHKFKNGEDIKLWKQTSEEEHEQLKSNLKNSQSG